MAREYVRRCEEIEQRPVDLDAWLNRGERVGIHPPVPLWFKLYIAVAFVASAFLVVTM